MHRSTLVVENRKEISKENKIIRKKKNTKILEEVKNVYWQASIFILG